MDNDDQLQNMSRIQVVKMMTRSCVGSLIGRPEVPSPFFLIFHIRRPVVVSHIFSSLLTLANSKLFIIIIIQAILFFFFDTHTLTHTMKNLIINN